MTTEHEPEVETEEALPEDVSGDVEVSAADEQEDVAPAKEWDEATEQEAREWGWKSPEDWKGDRSGLIEDPRAYLDRYGNIPIVKKAVERATKAEEAARKTEAALAAAYKRDLDRQRREYDSRIEAIQAQKRKAAEDADLDRYDQLDRLERETPRPEPSQPDHGPAILDPFKAEHPWLNDPFLGEQGAHIVNAGLARGEVPGGDTAAQIKYAEGKLKTYFPHMFAPPEPTPKPQPKVDGGGLAGALRKKEGFDTLPKDAKDTFAKYVKEGLFEDTKEDREQYFDDYQNG